jgi:hypothetical protein
MAKELSQLWGIRCECGGADLRLFHMDVVSKRHTTTGRRVRLIASDSGV